MRLMQSIVSRAWIGVLLICLFWSFACAQELSDGPSLEVLLMSHTENLTVVEANETQPGFRVGDNGYDVGDTVTTSTIYLQADPPSTGPPPSNKSVASPSAGYLVIQSLALTSSPANACTPFLRMRSQRVTFPLSLGIGIANSIGLQLHYNCSMIGHLQIQVDIKIMNGPAISCGWGKIIGNHRLGFDVGTFLFLPDVAYNGRVLSDWAPASHSTQVSAGVLSTPFNFWMSLSGELQQITKISVNATPNYCHPYIQGQALQTVTNVPSLILVVYNCSTNGTALITMDIKLSGGFEPLIVQWTKQSGGYREYFFVGTQPGASDVIWWGLTLPLWQDYRFTMQSKVESTTFYIVLSDAGDTQLVSQPSAFFNPNVAHVELSGSLASGGIVNNTVQELTVTYHCLVQGVTQVSVALPIPGYETASWNWTKSCGAARHDLNVGTISHWDDVVSKGVVTFLYSPTLHSAFVFPDTSSSTFYISLGPRKVFKPSNSSEPTMALLSADDNAALDDQIIIKNISLTVSQPSCTPFMTGNATDGVILTFGDQLLMTVTYNCTRPGSTNVSITLIIDGPYSPITFTWHKRVGAGRNALIVGTNPGWDDAVIGGLPTPLYDPTTFTAFYGQWQLSAKFYAQLKNNYSEQVVNRVSITSTFGCLPEIRTDWGSAKGGVWTDAVWSMEIWWNCFIGGKNVFMLTFDLQDWEPLTLAMTVYSGGPRPYLDIGTLKGAADVVLGGLPTPLWIAGPLNGATVSGNVLTSTFWLGMSRTGTTQTTSMPFLSFGGAANIIAPYINGTFANGGRIDSNYEQSFTVIYNCSGLGVVPISVGFLLPPYDSITFTWIKICSADRRGFFVGTTSGNNDVVEYGQATMAWNPLTHVAFVIGIEMETTFFVGEKQGGQLISDVIVNSSLPICSPYIVGDVIPGIVLAQGQILSFKVVYNCSQIGHTNIQVTLALSGNYLPASFMWTKRVSGVMDGLNVGTAKNRADVLYHGAPTFAYDPLSHNALITTYTTTFWASIWKLPPTLAAVDFLPTVAFSTSPWLLPDVIGPLAAKSTLTNLTSSSYTVIPHCLLSSDLLDEYASVFMAVTPVPFSPAFSSFFVDCPPNLVGLSVGFEDSTSDVVVDGIPTPSWSPANTTRIQIDADYNLLQFWVTAGEMMPLKSILIAEDGIIITEPLAEAPASCAGAEQEGFICPRKNHHRVYPQDDRLHPSTQKYKDLMQQQLAESGVHTGQELEQRAVPVISDYGYPRLPRPACSAILSGSVWDTLMLNTTAQLLQLELNCTIGGTNNVSVILVPRDDQLSSTVWTFSKTMGGFRHGFDVIAQPGGFTANTPLVAVEDGQTKGAWQNGMLGPGAIATQHPNASFVSFSVELDKISYGRDPLQEYVKPSINVSEPGVCYPVLLGNASVGGFIRTLQPLHLDVLSNCYGASPSPVFFDVTIPIPPFFTVTYAWQVSSSGIPTPVNIFAQLGSSLDNLAPVVIHGTVLDMPETTSDQFTLWISLDNSSIPQDIKSSPNASLALSGSPLLNSTSSTCVLQAFGNGSTNSSLSFDGTPLNLTVTITNCSDPTIVEVVTVTFSVLPYTTPIAFKLFHKPIAPTKPGFPALMVGLIIASSSIVIILIIVALCYFVHNRPAVPPSTGAYHLKRRELERKGEADPLLSPASMEQDEVNQMIN